MQRCHCTCDTVEDRSAGVRCRDFRSVAIPLLTHETAALFDAAVAWGMSSLALSGFPDRPAAGAGGFVASAGLAAGSSITPAIAVMASLFKVNTQEQMSRTDADAFTSGATSSVFFQDLRKRQEGFFCYDKPGSVTAVARALNMRDWPLSK